MSISTDIAAAQAAIAAVPAEYRHMITLEQSFIAAHMGRFVLIVLAVGVLFGLALAAIIAFGGGALVYGLWAIVLMLAAVAIAGGFRPKFAISR